MTDRREQLTTRVNAIADDENASATERLVAAMAAYRLDGALVRDEGVNEAEKLIRGLSSSS